MLELTRPHQEFMSECILIVIAISAFYLEIYIFLTGEDRKIIKY